jgi:hypothetical protein
LSTDRFVIPLFFTGDPLTRTRSMQPLLRAESSLFAQEKEALCRTRSTVPRLSLPPPPPPIQNQQMLQNNPATPEKKQPNYWPMPPPTTSTVDSSFGGGGGGGFEQARWLHTKSAPRCRHFICRVRCLILGSFLFFRTNSTNPSSSSPCGLASSTWVSWGLQHRPFRTLRCPRPRRGHRGRTNPS